MIDRRGKVICVTETRIKPVDAYNDYDSNGRAVRSVKPTTQPGLSVVRDQENHVVGTMHIEKVSRE